MASLLVRCDDGKHEFRSAEDLHDFLGVEDPYHQCLASPKAEGGRCGNKVNKEHRQQVPRLLAQLVQTRVPCVELASRLKELAGHVLCGRWHASKGEQVYETWRKRFWVEYVGAGGTEPESRWSAIFAWDYQPSQDRSQDVALPSTPSPKTAPSPKTPPNPKTPPKPTRVEMPIRGRPLEDPFKEPAGITAKSSPAKASVGLAEENRKEENTPRKTVPSLLFQSILNRFGFGAAPLAHDAGSNDASVVEEPEEMEGFKAESERGEAEEPEGEEVREGGGGEENADVTDGEDACEGEEDDNDNTVYSIASTVSTASTASTASTESTASTASTSSALTVTPLSTAPSTPPSTPPRNRASPLPSLSLTPPKGFRPYNHKPDAHGQLKKLLRMIKGPVEVRRCGYLYAFKRSTESGPLKIGHAKADWDDSYGRLSVAARLNKWQKDCGHKVDEVLSEWVACPAVERIERLVHLTLEECRLREDPPCKNCEKKSRTGGGAHNEWFEVDVTTAERVVGLWTLFAQQQPYDENGMLAGYWPGKIEEERRSIKKGDTVMSWLAEAMPRLVEDVRGCETRGTPKPERTRSLS